MACNPWDLMRELASMQERMNRTWNTAERGHEGIGDRGAWMPPVDIYQPDANEIVLKAELPGLRREDIDLTVENNTLTVRGQRRRDESVPEAAYHRVERTYGSFSRSFTLPNTVDTTGVRADYREGVLTVRLPLRAETRAQQIQVGD